MKTIKTGTEQCTHNYSDAMVALAMLELREYFADNKPRRPGDLEDDFTGQWSFSGEHWRDTPFFPALAVLVNAGEIVFETDNEGIVWYSTPGFLPSTKVVPKQQRKLKDRSPATAGKDDESRSSNGQ